MTRVRFDMILNILVPGIEIITLIRETEAFARRGDQLPQIEGCADEF